MAVVQGDRGRAIPGSRLHRNYCVECGAAIRVNPEDKNSDSAHCLKCMGSLGGGQPTRRSYPVECATIQYQGSMFQRGEW